MSKRLLKSLNAGVAFVLAMMFGAVAFVLTAVFYVAIGEIACAFHTLLPIPSTMAMVLIYAIYVIAISIWLYRWLRDRSQLCVTA